MATARRFAVAMGMIGVVVVCVSGVWRGASLESTLLRALVALLAFSLVGYLCGLLGAVIMKDAVNTEIARVKTARDARETVRGPSSSTVVGTGSSKSTEVSTEKVGSVR